MNSFSAPYCQYPSIALEAIRIIYTTNKRCVLANNPMNSDVCIIKFSSFSNYLQCLPCTKYPIRQIQITRKNHKRLLIYPAEWRTAYTKRTDLRPTMPPLRKLLPRKSLAEIMLNNATPLQTKLHANKVPETNI